MKVVKGNFTTSIHQNRYFSEQKRKRRPFLGCEFFRFPKFRRKKWNMSDYENQFQIIVFRRSSAESVRRASCGAVSFLFRHTQKQSSIASRVITEPALEFECN